MAIDVSQFFQLFFDEAEELLANLEKQLLSMDVDAPDAEALNAIFRVAHSIKGGAATFGFADLIDITHVMESMLDKIRHGEVAFTPAHQDVLLQAKDVLKMQIEGLRFGSVVDAEQLANVRMILASMVDQAMLLPVPVILNALASPPAASPPASALRCFHILLPDTTPSSDLQALRQELSLLGDLSRSSKPGQEDTLVLTTTASADDILALCSFVLNPDDVTLSEQCKPEEAVAMPSVEAAVECTASTEPVARKPAAKAETGAIESSTIRVNVEKVDQLINLVGELVITQAMLVQRSQALAPVQHEKLLSGISQLSRNTRDLQEAVMSIRMMPMDFVFSRFPRMVHELSSKLGKRINFVTEGDSTELDKGLIEKIIDPLTHLVRNSIDHGIETPVLRQQSGKSEVGQLRLSAAHQGSHIVLVVQDDGVGLNREKILAKARSQGHMLEDGLSDEEVWQLIFLPGFSTATVVTDVSGRGVGMDVVKNNIHALGGSVSVSSRLGQGTTTRISLPLTLAILDGMSVRVGVETYMLPLSQVVESFQPRAADVKSLNGQGMVVQVRGEYLPVISLAGVFDTESRSSDPASAILVIIASEAHKAALWVDELLGQQQVVVKNIETNYRRVANVSGATILGDGSVALIVDVGALLGRA
jgi:two-component system chemotaxis sensor kinase CheA